MSILRKISCVQWTKYTSDIYKQKQHNFILHTTLIRTWTMINFLSSNIFLHSALLVLNAGHETKLVTPPSLHQIKWISKPVGHKVEGTKKVTLMSNLS